MREAGSALTAWYAGRARDLPWRRNVSPYRVLVSEIMLQQTRTETVASRFEQFMERFPDPETLASAPEDEVLKLWEGLGYYSRARNLHKAAKVIAEQFGGQMPADHQQLLSLPGVGEYTAAAVETIAFGRPAVALDANAVRIALRLEGAELEAVSKAGRALARSRLEAMLTLDQPDVFTQAVMELGQTVCRPRRAECSVCPLRPWCAGQADPLRYPAARQEKAKPVTVLTVAALFTPDMAALRRRPDGGLLAGLYEPLNWAGELTQADLLGRLEGLGIEVNDAVRLRPWRHEFTHRVWQLTGWRIAVREPKRLQDIVWADRDMLGQRCAVPTAFRPAIAEWECTPWKTLWSRDPFSGIT